MKDFDKIKEDSNKLLGIANKIKLLGKKLLDFILIEKILVTISKRYKTFITSLEKEKIYLHLL